VFGGCMTNNNGFWIRWLDLLALRYDYNQLWHITIYECLRFAPFLIGLRMSYLPLWRMPNEESLPTHWTLFWIDYDSFITFRRPEYRSPPRRINCPSRVVMGMSLLIFVAAETVANEPLPSKWISASVRWYSDFQAVFTEPLPSKWSCYSQYSI
jgi:hypothetical protein